MSQWLRPYEAYQQRMKTRLSYQPILLLPYNPQQERL